MKKIQGLFPVIQNKQITECYWHMVIDAPSIAKSAKPGQFIHIRITEGLEPLLRRPFSIYRARKHIEIFYDVVGKSTKIMASKKKGEELDVMGPLGTPFTLPPSGTKNIVMIAGGVGAAPFQMLTDAWRNKGFNFLFLYGGRSKTHTFSMKDLKNNGCKILIATDDGSVGKKGRVSVLFDKIITGPESTYIYACGPRPMIAAVQSFARDNGFQGQASLEEVMACGLGACLGCATKTTGGYKTVCHDGPVFKLDEIVF